MPVSLITTPAKKPVSPVYTLVDTAWGPLAFVSCADRLLRLYLPSRAIKPLLANIKRDFPHAESAKNNLPQLQTELADYFHQSPNRSACRTASIQNAITLPEKNLSKYPCLFNCRVDISWASDFAQSILKACCKVKPGQTITYSQLAQNAAHPRTACSPPTARPPRAACSPPTARAPRTAVSPPAARAAGSVMAANRVPLIIPCHRIITSTGQLGGYSAPGGVKMKAKLLQHEYRLLNPA